MSSLSFPKRWFKCKVILFNTVAAVTMQIHTYNLKVPQGELLLWIFFQFIAHFSALDNLGT